MLVKGDKLIVTKDVASFLKKGEIVEVVAVEDDIISFVFGDGLHKGMMNHAEYEAHFKKYEEPKKAPTVSEEHIEYIIRNAEIDVETVFDKCTIVTCKLPNGFVIVESSACVSSENYDENMGVEICMQKIIDKVWELEGYVLQSKIHEENKCYDCNYCCDCDCDDCDECDEDDSYNYVMIEEVLGC